MNESETNGSSFTEPGADYFDLLPEEKIDAISKLWRKYHPESDRGPSAEKGGYYHLPLRNPRSAQHPGYEDAYDAILETILAELPELTSSNVDRAKELMGQEYKIHLMPQGGNVLSVVEALLASMREDRLLGSTISAVKIIDISRFMRVMMSEVMPTIVIYPLIGKSNAQYVLHTLCKRLESHTPFGEGKKPRYNQRVNDLIFYAQGGGGFKKRFIKAMTAAGKDATKTELFEPDFVHLKGDPGLPATAGSDNAS